MRWRPAAAGVKRSEDHMFPPVIWLALSALRNGGIVDPGAASRASAFLAPGHSRLPLAGLPTGKMSVLRAPKAWVGQRARLPDWRPPVVRVARSGDHATAEAPTARSVIARGKACAPHDAAPVPITPTSRSAESASWLNARKEVEPRIQRAQDEKMPSWRSAIPGGRTLHLKAPSALERPPGPRRPFPVCLQHTSGRGVWVRKSLHFNPF